jgi:AraC-like DNA-binding protein
MFAWFFYLTIRIALRIGRVIKQIEVFEFSDTQDYTKTFAGYVQWLPTTLCILSLTTYLCHNPWVKFGYDIICIIFTVGFVIFTLDPWREVDFVENKEIVENISQGNTEKSKWRMSESRYLALKGNLMELFENKHIYLTPHLTLDMLLKELSTNRNYLCETIARSGFKSFYDIVNSYRITHAINLIETEPEAKMIDIAIRSGFASAASMNKAFTQQGQPSPSKFRTSNT